MYPGFLLAYNSSGHKPRKYFPIVNEKTNTKGELSLISKRKIRNAVNNLVLISEPQTRVSDKGHNYTFKINFITLTLPSAQIHTDYELKALVNDWLKGWSRKGLKSYVWKAEKQKNGNIHFHITTNHYIHHTDIRNSWNVVLRRLGYIEKYRSAQLEWHKNGFKPRKDIFRLIRGKKVKWSRSAQLAAYKKGSSENWNNPNTTDVHSVAKIENLEGYICKYISKNKGDKINGRLWGCSRNLLRKPRNLDKIEVIEAWKYLEHEEGRGGFHWWILPRKHIKSPLLLQTIDEFKLKLKGELPESCPLEISIDPFQGQLQLNLPDPPKPKQTDLYEINLFNWKPPEQNQV